MADTPDAPRAEGIGAQLKNIKPWQWAVVGGIGIAVVGYILKKRMGGSSGTVQLTPNPSGQPIVISGGAGGTGSGQPIGNPPEGAQPPTIPPPAAPFPPAAPTPTFDPSQLHPDTGPFYSAFTDGPNGQSGSSTYYTYATPTGGAPSIHNMPAGWTLEDLKKYNAQVAAEWGLDPNKTGILN